MSLSAFAEWVFIVRHNRRVQNSDRGRPLLLEDPEDVLKIRRNNQQKIKKVHLRTKPYIFSSSFGQIRNFPSEFKSQIKMKNLFLLVVKFFAGLFSSVKAKLMETFWCGSIDPFSNDFPLRTYKVLIRVSENMNSKLNLIATVWWFIITIWLESFVVGSKSTIKCQSY